MLKLLGVILVVVVVLIVGFAVATSLASRGQPALGVQDGKLTPCPASPNCVSSQAEDAEHRVEPIRLEGDPQQEFEKLCRVVAEMPRTRILEQRPDYLRAEAVTPLLRYRDDVELLLDDETGVAHVRSASRVGYSDLGANRQRVEQIRRRYMATR